MIEYRLAPFVKLIYSKDSLIVVAPDNIVELELEASLFIESATGNWVGYAKDAQELNNLGVLISNVEMNEYIELLYRLETYFTTQNMGVRLTKKGATQLSASIEGYAYFFDSQDDESVGYGMDSNKWLAMLKATAEFYERISCSYVRNSYHSGNSIRSLPINSLMKYEGWQIDSRDFEYQNAPSGYWIEARSIDHELIAGVPLEYQCYPDGIDGPKLCSANSNGVAAHHDINSALVGSIYELIERDSLMVHWFNKIPREQIKMPKIYAQRVNKLSTLGFTVRAINLTLDLAPVIMVMITRHGDKFPRHVLGLASAPTALAALDKALSEVELSVTYYDKEMSYPVKQEHVRSVISHQLWYDLPQNNDEIKFFFNNEVIDIEEIADGPHDVASINKELKSQGFDWYYTILNPDGYKITGICTVRSIVPSLVPITFGYGCEPLAMDRLHNPPFYFTGLLDKSRFTEEGYKLQPFA